WRNVAMTAPYFHDGSVKSLAEAVLIMAKVQLDVTLSDSDVVDIVEFLKTLTGKSPHVSYPVFPRPAGHALAWQD
ncbi:MAG: cytochrome C peroxidase, partial [Mariprofundales bacterium]|nr:cytochrome C peroxidase [Mariprofundales bacterium]